MIKFFVSCSIIWVFCILFIFKQQISANNQTSSINNFQQMITNNKSSEKINLYKIYKGPMRSKSLLLITLAVLFSVCNSQLCTSPQKSFYMSYSAVSNHDYLADVFQNVSQSLPQYNITYTDKNGSVYSVLNFKPHLYYNQHRQEEFYVDALTANVSLGQLTMAYRFDISIKHENLNKTGWGRGRTLVDQYWFLKKLRMIDGGLEWDPYNLNKLDINSQFSIEFSDPKLTQDETAIYIQLLNDYLGTVKIKENTILKTNQLFIDKLQYHLNHEPLIKNSSFSYSYGNITLDYVNVIRDFQLTNGITKGLQAFMLFGFESGPQNCTDLPTEFDQESYGGIQEVFSMGIVKTTIQKAINMGLTNAVLDKKYEVPYFQFFMGDLGNFVDYANKLPAHDPINISCAYAADRANELKISRFDQHDLYVQIPEDCNISYKNAPILKVAFDMNMVVRLIPEDDTLTTSILTVSVYGDKYYSLDKNFAVTDPYVARYTLTAMLKGLVGKKTFGTGWKLFGRKYPVARINDDFIVFFDGSQK